MMQLTFLVEVGTEELPHKALRSLAESFAENFTRQLTQAELPYSEVLWYASPRRLALKVTNLGAYQADREVQKRGPVISIAFDVLGKPTRASQEWARSCGIQVEQAERLVNEKGEWLFYRAIIKGQAAQTLLVDMVANALSTLSIQKLMRWGDKTTQFVRPVHTLIMLLNDQLLEGKVLGVQSSRIIRGHRFIGEAEMIMSSAAQYPAILRERGKVIADYEERKALIKHQAHQIAQKLGGIVALSDSLLEEVTSLVEWPVVLSAKFEQQFLSLPAEILIQTMESDQKYFPVYDPNGNLMSNFIFVANIDSSVPQQIIAGNEQVIHSRLADAEFFFKTDCLKRLEDYLPQLESILFQKQLGTLRDKSDRLTVLAGWIAAEMGIDVHQAMRAALLSKCDLMTNIVSEFPDIQGVMGMHYARLDGEAEDVAISIKEQYQPRFSGDQLPTNHISATLALADKMDTLVGMVGIHTAPKGDKDPFALRRAALGVLRIIVEKGYDLDLSALIKETAHLYGNKLTNKNVIDDVIEFMLERFRFWYQEQGYPIDIIHAVLARRPTKPADFDARVKAIAHFRTLEVAESLERTNKRIANILAKSNEQLNANISTNVLKAPEEVMLAAHLNLLKQKLSPLLADRKYQSVLMELASLREAIDAFFENVMVMDVDDIVRINRLTLLSQLRDLFLQVADISLLK
ncbi:MAG: glycine--tRNA ligase subunit beta [Candidatus Arsenophonus melophagi]|nr:glycine--tRNA ligase subunit beta [Candidatus Arsenophonus melophagi]